MRLINELRNEPIATSGSRDVEALVQVRGIDAGHMFGRSDVRFERHTPVAVVVREAGAIRRLTLPTAPTFHPIAIVAPVAAYLLARSLTKGPKRRLR